MRISSLNPAICDEIHKSACAKKKDGNTCNNFSCFNGVDWKSIHNLFTDIKLNVILTGCNGSGKTRLLKLIEEKNQALNIRGVQDNGSLNGTSIELDKIRIINFSCNDSSLQSVDKFPTFTISKAHQHLDSLDVTETALNSLLFIHALAKGYIESNSDFNEFADYVNALFSITSDDLKLKRSDTGVNFFGRQINGDELSPGQKYLLRMAVALFLNRGKYDVVFLLDEPETHLHPDALIKFYDKLRSEFLTSQIWVATHSIALIAHIEHEYNSDCSIFYFYYGVISLHRSNSEPLIKGLVGGEANWSAYFHFLVEPDTYASNKFAIECLTKPKVIQGINKKDEQAKLITNMLSQKIIIDYGAGRGRLITAINEWLCEENKEISEIIREYRAFDISNEHKTECLDTMKQYNLGNNYSNDIKQLKELQPAADFVFMVNVLHEINPTDWIELFECISKLLKDDGVLIIVEQKELTIGEKAHENGFLILTEKTAKALFSNSITVETPEGYKSIKFIISKSELNCNRQKVINCLQLLMAESLGEIEIIHSKEYSNSGRFKYGIKLAFWEHQHTNAELFLSKILANSEGQSYV